MEMNKDKLAELGQQKLEYDLWFNQQKAANKIGVQLNSLEVKMQQLYNNYNLITNYLGQKMLGKKLTSVVASPKAVQDKIDGMDSEMMDIQKNVADFQSAYKELDDAYHEYQKMHSKKEEDNDVQENTRS